MARRQGWQPALARDRASMVTDAPVVSGKVVCVMCLSMASMSMGILHAGR